MRAEERPERDRAERGRAVPVWLTRREQCDVADRDPPLRVRARDDALAGRDDDDLVGRMHVEPRAVAVAKAHLAEMELAALVAAENPLIFVRADEE